MCNKCVATHKGHDFVELKEKIQTLFKPWANLRSSVNQSKTHLEQAKDKLPAEELKAFLERAEKLNSKYKKLSEARDKKDIQTLIQQESELEKYKDKVGDLGKKLLKLYVKSQDKKRDQKDKTVASSQQATTSSKAATDGVSNDLSQNKQLLNRLALSEKEMKELHDSRKKDQDKIDKLDKVVNDLQERLKIYDLNNQKNIKLLSDRISTFEKKHTTTQEIKVKPATKVPSQPKTSLAQNVNSAKSGLPNSIVTIESSEEKRQPSSNSSSFSSQSSQEKPQKNGGIKKKQPVKSSSDDEAPKPAEKKKAPSSSESMDSSDDE